MSAQNTCIPHTKKQLTKDSERDPFSNDPREDLILEDSAVPTKNTSPNDTAALEEDAGLLQPNIRTKANFLDQIFI